MPQRLAREDPEHDLNLVHPRRDGDPERNARVFDSEGRRSFAFTIGDGISDVQAASNGRIWASYFDEGVFGNFGWDQPLGNSGLVAWDADGNRLFEYSPVNGLDTIFDCYAMNISGNVIWIYYYFQFPLVKIRGTRVVKHWNVPISGSDAFAISESHALFSDSYDKRDQYHLMPLDGPKPEISKTVELRDSNDHRIVADRVIGRNDSLFLLNKFRVFRLSIQAVTNEGAKQ